MRGGPSNLGMLVSHLHSVHAGPIVYWHSAAETRKGPRKAARASVETILQAGAIDGSSRLVEIAVDAYERHNRICYLNEV
jgi:hypothetical protein